MEYTSRLNVYWYKNTRLCTLAEMFTEKYWTSNDWISHTDTHFGISKEIIGHLWPFHLLFYECYELGHTTVFTYCFSSTIWSRYIWMHGMGSKNGLKYQTFLISFDLTASYSEAKIQGCVHHTVKSVKLHFWTQNLSTTCVVYSSLYWNTVRQSETKEHLEEGGCWRYFH